VIRYGSCEVKSDVLTIEMKLEMQFFGGLCYGEVTISVKNVCRTIVIIILEKLWL